uniref:NSFL1 cofactor p47 n=1 Tax=Nomascus leucogenys TaxID=61853 RepID=A0A2I3HVB2_NOMLE
AAEQQEALREFVAVTGTEEDRACFFESATWDLQIALASFYDTEKEDIITISQATSRSVSRGTAPSDNRVTSFRDFTHDQDEDEEEEEGQRFHAGASERSGQQTVGPPRKKSPNELVDDLFKGAKEHGAVAVERVTKRPGETSTPRPFAGGGYGLGTAPEEESAYVTGEKRQHSSQDVHVVLKLCKSGFNPSNAQFLESIHRGEVPAELWRLAHSGQANLDMEGQKLSSTTTTNIQIRLADGVRLVQKFNHSHRISNIQLFIVDARPAMAATSFILMTTFPNKELADESWTLKEANLLNAAIMQW